MMAKNGFSRFFRPEAIAFFSVLSLLAVSCQSGPKTLLDFRAVSGNVPVMLASGPAKQGRPVQAEEYAKTQIFAYDTTNAMKQSVHVVETNTWKSKYPAVEQLLSALGKGETVIGVDSFSFAREMKGDVGTYDFKDTLTVKARALGGLR